MKQLKHMSYDQLVATIHDHPACTPDLITAVELATDLHRHQTRKDPVQGRENTPYIEHCLRNVVRLIRFGCTDEMTLTGAVLHDTVEDCALEYAPDAHSEEAARLILRAHIVRVFGEEAALVVDGVTNPYESDEERRTKRDEQKFADYQQKVAKAIASDVRIYLVKLSDYIDNAGSLHYTPHGRMTKAQRLATKYLPLVEVFRAIGRKHAAAHPQMADWETIDTTLVRIGERLEMILAGQMPKGVEGP